jgi:hypothetical protein
VVIAPDLIVTTQPLDVNECVGGTNSINVAIANGSGTISYQWQSSATNVSSSFANISGATSSTYTPSSATAGTTYYRVIISASNNGCDAVPSNVSTVVIAPDLSIVAQPMDINECVGGTDFVLINIVNGSGTVTYQWQKAISNVPSSFVNILGATTSTYTPSSTIAGTTYYRVLVASGNAGCDAIQSSTSTVVVAPDLVVAVQPLDLNECIGGTNSIFVTPANGSGTITYQWQSATINTPVSFVNISGATSATFTPPSASAGTVFYRAIISASNAGCDPITSLVSTVVIAPDLTITTQPQNLVECLGASNSINVISANGSGTVTYQWQSSTTNLSANFVNISGANASTYTPSSAVVGVTYYRVVISASNSGCDQITSAVSTVTIPQPIANAGPDVTLCNSATVVIGTTALAGNTYLWSPSTGLTSTTNAQTTASPSTTTTYNLIVTNTATGCTNTDAVIVNVNGLPGVSAGLDQTICSGESVQIGSPAVVGNIYIWSPATNLSATNVAQPNASPSASTTYTVVVTNTATGCTSTDAVVINVNPLPNTNAGSDVFICNGGSTLIGSPAIAGNTYAWSPSTNLSNANNANPTANPIATSTYTLVVTNTLTGCSDTDEIVVNVNPLPIANAGLNQSICNNAAIQIGTVAVAGNTYLWTPASNLSSPTAANPTANPSSTTTYTVVVTNTATGCTNSDAVVVSVNGLPTVDLGSSKTICQGQSVQIGVSPAAGYTYAWTPSAGLSSSTIGNPISSPLGTTTYAVMVTNTVTGCTSTDSYLVNVRPTPIASAVSTGTFCENAPLVVSASGGTTYAWTTPMGTLNTAIATFDSVPVSGSGTYSVVVGNIYGCTATASTIVSISPSPQNVSALGGIIKCSMPGVQLVGNSTSSGVTYAWTGPNGFTSTSKMPTVTAAGVYNLEVSFNGSGCFSSIQTNVTIDTSAVDVNATGGLLNCQFTSVNLVATANRMGLTYAWTGPGGFTSSIKSPTVTLPGTYTVVATNPVNGCTDLATVTIVKSVVTPTVTATGDALNCNKTIAQLTATSNIPNAIYNWTGPNGFVFQGQNPKVSQAGTYTVVVTDPVTGCQSSSATATVVLQ